ncbi:peptide chain release factor 1 [Falsiroseomonas sp.]|uniref:peptide chain release factor 1 n=1 Tax=Falsiroseomonas sp. TaxID=2870721 RepID=UPI003F70AA13
MTDREIDLKIAELDRLLNDPETRMDPHKVWSLLAEIRRQTMPTTQAPRAA